MGQLEYLNPSGAIKVRIAKYMIERAERGGAPGPRVRAVHGPQFRRTPSRRPRAASAAPGPAVHRHVLLQRGEKYINDYFLGAWPTVGGPAGKTPPVLPHYPGCAREEPGLIPLRLNIRAIRLTPTASVCNGFTASRQPASGTGDG